MKINAEWSSEWATDLLRSWLRDLVLQGKPDKNNNYFGQHCNYYYLNWLLTDSGNVMHLLNL